MTGKWYDVSTLECRKLVEYGLSDLGERRSICCCIISLSASLSLNWLECHSSDAWLLTRELEDLPDFMIVLSLLDDYDECCGYVVFVEIFDGFHSDFCQISTSELAEVVTIERVKLQIDLKIGLISSKSLGKCLVFSNLDTIRIYHEIPKWSFLGSVKYLPEVRMDSGFTSGYLYYIGFCFMPTYRIEHSLDLLDRLVISCGI